MKNGVTVCIKVGRAGHFWRERTTSDTKTKRQDLMSRASHFRSSHKEALRQRYIMSSAVHPIENSEKEVSKQ